ncbi:MAG: ABC transporter permease [bacterium]|nr:ABC transporter permease [bacterium]
MGAASSDLTELRVQPGRPMRMALGLAFVLIAIGVWWVLTRGATAEERIISPVLLPSPAEVVLSVKSLVQRDLHLSIAATLRRVLMGFALAIAVGVPLGVLAGSWRGIDSFLFPLSVFGRNIPIAALIPLSVLWFGTGESQKSMFIFIATVPFVFGNAVQAVVDVPDRYVETARTLGASRFQTIMKVLVPLSMPAIFDGLRILFGLAFGYIMLAEVIDAGHGLGHLINMSQRRGLNEHIYLILIMIGFLAYGIDRVLFWFQKGLFPYRFREGH